MLTSLTQADLASIAAEPYETRGIPHSEMALILHTCRRLSIEVVIESGRARGQSTALLSKYLPDAKIYSVEQRSQHPDTVFGLERCASLPNVTLIDGDGRDALPRLAAFAAPARCAILCDGPKGAAAVAVLEACFAYPHVIVGFIHDMRRLDHGAPSPHRAAAIARLPHHKFSDEQALTAASSWMDANVLAAGGPVGPAHEAEFGSYGPTIGVFFNSQATKQ